MNDSVYACAMLKNIDSIWYFLRCVALLIHISIDIFISSLVFVFSFSFTLAERYF